MADSISAIVSTGIVALKRDAERATWERDPHHASSVAHALEALADIAGRAGALDNASAAGMRNAALRYRQSRINGHAATTCAGCATHGT